MTQGRAISMIAWAVAVLAAMGGCKPPEPQPSLHTDLGDGDLILLPPPKAWHDPAVARGQAEWKPFRKPGEASAAEVASSGDGAPGAGAGASGVEKEIRALVDEYNGLVKDGKYSEALDYLTEGTAAVAEKMVQAVPAFDAKLRELGEAIPAVAERAQTVGRRLSLGNMLNIEIKDIRVRSATEVAADFVDASSGEAPAGDKRPEIRFHKAEGGDWFIDARQLESLGTLVEALSVATASLDSLIAAAKSGALSGAALDEVVAALNTNFDRLISFSKGESQGVELVPILPSTTESPSAEEPPPPKKPPPRGG